jgi:hypothetical protein
MSGTSDPFSMLVQMSSVALLLQDPSVYGRFPTLWSAKHFTDNKLRVIVHAFLNVRRFGEHPSVDSLTQELCPDGIKTTDQVVLMKELNRLLNASISNKESWLSKYRELAKSAEMMEAIEKSICLLQTTGSHMGIATVINRAALAGNTSQLAGDDFFTLPPRLAMEIIPNVLRQGYVGILNSTSKAFKSWNLLALAIASATGKQWLGFPACNRAKPLYVNLELEEEEFKVRVDQVAAAMGTTRLDLKGKMGFLNLKGQATDLATVLTLIKAHRDSDDPWKLIIIDPIYKLIATDDAKENVENSNAHIGALFGRLEELARELETAIFFVHHFKKGNSGATSNIDSGSGAGTFGRAPDVILSMKPLEEDNAWRIESDLRYYGKIEPFAVRLGTGNEFPLLVRDPLLDADDIEGALGRPKKYSVDQVLEVLPETGLKSKVWSDLSTSKYGFSDKTFRILREEALEKGLVEASGDTSKSSTVYTPTANAKAAMLNSLQSKLFARAGLNGSNSGK